MVLDVSHLVAAICPDVFCEPKVRPKVKTILGEALARKDALAYVKAAETAQPVEPNAIAIDKLKDINLFRSPGQRSPMQQHILTLDNPDESLEALYFNLLEHLQAQEGWQVQLLVDTVNATTGAGFHSDLTRRIQQQQQQAAQLMIRIHGQIRTLVQQWQKWREQGERLQVYEAARSYVHPDQEAALSLLESRWRRAGEADPEAPEYVGKVKDFETWRKLSEEALRQRLATDRALLINELHFLKFQAMWLKPYLPPVRQKQNKNDPELVTAFNTAMFELVLLVELPSEIELFVKQGDLPQMLLGKKHRRPRPVLVVELKFRAIPERTKSGSYAYRGKAEFKFTSYALNDHELAVLQREVTRNEYGELFGMLESKMPESLNGLLSDLDELLGEAGPKPVNQKPERDDPNPFVALFSWFKTSGDASGSVLQEPLRPDTDVEKVLRSFALLAARKQCQEIYQSEKQALTLKR